MMKKTIFAALALAAAGPALAQSPEMINSLIEEFLSNI